MADPRKLADVLGSIKEGSAPSVPIATIPQDIRDKPITDAVKAGFEVRRMKELREHYKSVLHDEMFKLPKRFSEGLIKT